MISLSNYPFIVLPTFVDPSQRSRAYANEFFQWFISQEDMRVSIFKDQVLERTGQVLDERDLASLSTAWKFVVESLVVKETSVGDKTKGQAKLLSSGVFGDNTKGISQELQDIISSDSLSVVPAAETICVCYDFGYFISKCMKHAHELSHWMLVTDKESIDYNEPVLALTGSGRINVNPPKLVIDCVWRKLRGDNEDQVRKTVERTLFKIRSLKKNPKDV